jgi:cytochrome c oxidase cbb3-type subunit III
MKKLIPPYIRVLFIFFSLIAVEITLNAVNTITYRLLSEEEKAKLALEDSLSLSEKSWYKNLMQRLTRTVPIEDEKQLLMDHDYDGIKELDNNLPPWWVYLFYACIIFSVIYLVRYEIMGAPDQETELKNEMAQAKIEVAEYMKTAPDLMDENSVTLLTEPADLTNGKAIFETNCAACHRADGGGQIGPNLTDDNWILGGGIKKIFHTVTNGGRDGKGMIAWKGTLKPKEIQAVASYIISLKGSNPKDPKAPEGDVWVDENAPATTAAAPVADSTEVK